MLEFIKHINREEHAADPPHLVHKWVKSDMNYNYSNENVHN